jgi:hypothetical protein
VRLDFVPASLSDDELDHVEWRVLAALQHYVSQPIPQRQLGARLRMKPHHVGDVIDALAAKGYLKQLRPTAWNEDGSWREATRLTAIKRHAVVGEKVWLTIPSKVEDTYGHDKATALRLRLHGLQMLEQRERGDRRDPTSLPWIAPRKAAARLGGLDPDSRNDRERIATAYQAQRRLGWLTKAVPAKRQRLRLPDGTRRRITGATVKKLSLARTLIDKLPDEVTLALAAELAPAGRPLRLDPLIDNLRRAIRESAILDEAVYRYEHGIDQPPEPDEDERKRLDEALANDLDEIDRRDSKYGIGDTRRDSKHGIGHTGTSGRPKPRGPKGSSLRDQEKEIESLKVAGDQERSESTAEARKGGGEKEPPREPSPTRRSCPECEVGGGRHGDECSFAAPRYSARDGRWHTNSGAAVQLRPGRLATCDAR